MSPRVKASSDKTRRRLGETLGIRSRAETVLLSVEPFVGDRTARIDLHLAHGVDRKPLDGIGQHDAVQLNLLWQVLVLDALMKKFQNMEHDEPYMAHVGAGKKGEIVWNFNKVGEFDFACLLPGH